jgi:predicted ArsR family transcriptional regulator
MAERFEHDVAGVAALADPVRRRLYEHVVGQPDAVGRDEAAAAAGIKRPLAAFHLDKLVDEGLLEVEYRRLTGRTGPGAGRPAKLYRRSQREFDVTLPPREYDLVGQILAAGIQRAAEGGGEVLTCVRQVAFERGEQLAPGPDADAVEALMATLREHGFEPRREDGGIVLANCPFHALAQDFTELVCGMNLALCQGLSAAVGLDRAGLEPTLQPQDERCCVTFVAVEG